MNKLGLIFLVGFIWVTAALPDQLVCGTAVAQAPSQEAITSQGLQFSVASARMIERGVAVQLLVKNTIEQRQYLTNCQLPSSGASLTSGQRLELSSLDISGIPNYSTVNIGSCLSQVKLDDMTYIEPNSTLVVLLRFRGIDDIAGGNSISFPLNLAVRTDMPSGAMDSPSAKREPGPMHPVNIAVPLIPISTK